jgi:hypothetical protein
VTNADKLRELADRVERAIGPDREIDRDIALALGMYDRPEDLGCFVDPAEAVVAGGGQTWAPPEWTASLHAAKALKHHGDLWCVGRMEDGPFARVVPAIPGAFFGDEITVYAATTENALTAALLRAAALRAIAAGEKA